MITAYGLLASRSSPPIHASFNEQRQKLSLFAPIACVENDSATDLFQRALNFNAQWSATGEAALSLTDDNFLALTSHIHTRALEVSQLHAELVQFAFNMTLWAANTAATKTRSSESAASSSATQQQFQTQVDLVLMKV